MALDERIRWAVDISPADWIGPRLRPFNQDTGSVVPEGFDAYCRLFHPDGPIYPDGSFRSWAEIAASNGRIVHPNMQFHMIDRPIGSPLPDPLGTGSGPSVGTLPPRERQRLSKLLRPETGTPDRCWFCIWDGFGGIEVGQANRVRLPHRQYALYGGPIDLVMASLDVPWDTPSPNLWWPDDHAWIVTTEIDYAWTYVGGSQQVIDKIVSDDLLEALPVRLDDLPFFTSDTVKMTPRTADDPSAWSWRASWN